MHIPENYLAPAACAVMATAMLPVWYNAAKNLKHDLAKEQLPMLGVGAAFSFLIMMFNVPLIGGTTGHAVGGTLMAVLFGPRAACIAISIALLVQAFIFGDGGILAFGANCFNMAFVLPYSGYVLYRLLSGRANCIFTGGNGHLAGKAVEAAGTVKFNTGLKNAGFNHAGINHIGLRETGLLHTGFRQKASLAIAAYIAMNLAALCAAVEFGVQPLLFTDSLGQAMYCPYGLTISIPAMVIPHLLLGGIVEAAFTVAVFSFVAKVAPSMLCQPKVICEQNGDVKPRSYTPIYSLIGIMIALCPLGLLTEGTAWGEWGAEEIAGTTDSGQTLGYVPSGIADGWNLGAFMPDYSLAGCSDSVAYILSAAIGVLLLLGIFKLIYTLKCDG